MHSSIDSRPSGLIIISDTLNIGSTLQAYIKVNILKNCNREEHGGTSVAPWKNDMPVIGRLLTCPEFRGEGKGAALLAFALDRIEEIYPETSVRISAQHYLLGFYRKFGIYPVSEIFEEDGIPHITMVRPPPSN
jgi:predicted GNAT family N-acyltransferase